MTDRHAWLWIWLAASACGDTVAPGADAAMHAMPDAAVASDAGDPDARVGDAAAPADAALDAGLVLPETLAEAGLYADFASETLAEGVRAFVPAFPLWSDGAEKRRWLYLPPGTTIDTSDPDAWRYPVGTKAFKEFTRDGKRIETRLLFKTDAGWYMVAFAWNEAQSQAVAVLDGVENALGTEHDIPPADDCRDCHEGVVDVLLGASAIQLSHDEPGVNVLGLVADGRLSDPPPVGDYRLPDEPAWNALGYLHANCGNCHNPASATFDRVDMRLWLPTAARRDATVTPTHVTSVGVASSETDPGYALRVDPGSPDTSGLVHRMLLRGDDAQMPPLASEQVDDAGVALVRAWIESL